VLEHKVASDIHNAFSFPIYTLPSPTSSTSCLHAKIDLAATLGGDGTILHASSLFSTTTHVPPVLAFSMGTLGFLGEWKFHEYKRAFRDVYMSGASGGFGSASEVSLSEGMTKPEKLLQRDIDKANISGWATLRGKAMGASRSARILRRSRLKVGVFDSSGNQVPSTAEGVSDVYAMNEVILHRGATPHLTHISVTINGRFLTSAVADGMIVSTPTGSTAYSLSSGGSIIHPTVPSLLLTPICPRSLSFRPLVLPSNAHITLKLEETNRAREVEVSIDGARRPKGVEAGMEVRVWGEEVREGGVPCVMRSGAKGEMGEDDGWVGGLNGLLKFNYPFGEEAG
jgi:NADH kinase